MQNRVELPMLLSVNPLRFCDRLLSVAFIAIFWHNEDRRYSFSGNAVFTIYNTDNADLYTVCRYEVVCRFGLIESEQNILKFFSCRTGFVS